jgi:hypothetical protein
MDAHARDNRHTSDDQGLALKRPFQTAAPIISIYKSAY